MGGGEPVPAGGWEAEWRAVRERFARLRAEVRTDPAALWALVKGMLEEASAAAAEFESAGGFGGPAGRAPGEAARVSGAPDRRAALLAEASRVLGASLDPEPTIHAVARAAVPLFADCCLVHLVRAGRVERAEVAARDPELESLLRDVARRSPPDLGRAAPLRAVMETGRPVLFPSVPDELLAALVPQPEDLERVRGVGFRSAIVVPMVARGRLLGTLCLIAAESGRAYGEEDLALAEEFAARAALALENALLYREAQEAVRARDEVLATVSHDLRNPLHTILMAASLLGETLPAEARTPAALRSLDALRRAAQQMERLIQDLLDIVRIEAGQLALHPRPEDPAAIVREAVLMLEPLAVEKSLRLEVELPDPLPPVRADRQRILQVLSNLIGNAIKFTPAGGRIVLRGRATDPEVELSVSDTGPGIPPEQLPHIFRPFWQAHRTPGAGAGLGLAIARGIVHGHGGRIWVESELGRGTTVSFTLPLAVGEGGAGAA